MKTETRMFTEERTVYISDNGCCFITEQECKDYEMSLLEDSIAMYDNDLDECGLRKCVYVRLGSETDIANFKKLCDWAKYTTDGITDEVGVYKFDYDTYAWSNLSKLVNRIMEGKDET